MLELQRMKHLKLRVFVERTWPIGSYTTIRRLLQKLTLGVEQSLVNESVHRRSKSDLCILISVCPETKRSTMLYVRESLTDIFKTVPKIETVLKYAYKSLTVRPVS